MKRSKRVQIKKKSVNKKTGEKSERKQVTIPNE
jgi:hypothetical protein